MAETLPQILTATIDRWYGGIVTRLAEDLHLTLSVVARVLKGQANLGPEPLLALAQITGRPYTDLLRVAGHHRLAEGLDAYYGIRPTLSRHDHKLLERLGALNIGERRLIEQALVLFQDAHRRQAGQTHPGRAGGPDRQNSRLHLGQ